MQNLSAKWLAEKDVVVKVTDISGKVATVQIAKPVLNESGTMIESFDTPTGKEFEVEFDSIHTETDAHADGLEVGDFAKVVLLENYIPRFGKKYDYMLTKW